MNCESNTSMDLTGKVVLITGAGQGLGRHFSTVLARAGATVVATSIKSEMNLLTDLVDEITKNGGGAFAFDLDLKDTQNFENKINEIISKTEHIDVLINNAGISYYTKFFDIQEKDWDAHLDVNLKGAFFLSKIVAKHMVDNKINGSIVNIGSVAGSQAKKYALPFCVSKAGLHHLTKIMAYELAHHGIRVNCISPGLYPSPRVKDYIESAAGKNMVDQIPLKRPGKYDELNGALLLLASDASSYMTGSIVEVDGGFSIDIFLKEDFENNKTNEFFKDY